MSTNATDQRLKPGQENGTASHASIHDETIGHGNTPAAWTCVLIMIVGAAVSSVAFIMASFIGFFAGIAVMLIGLVVGFIMRKAGYGVNGSKLKNSGH
ncbi:HGxxPAAW family protein [Arthrobacter yangruifuii]|uniref:Uncharacterized protein n=1 Tax=Arthrobacter yangruifuii TaxID=2606616 RepID=A0A5N6MH57_9MICC|nr:HGxxPAAW family protein [Arthrobacter yangruifuii]KAD3633054.1 hypothetical protein GD627_09425 [Arthrobacter yangruifuii]